MKALDKYWTQRQSITPNIYICHYSKEDKASILKKTQQVFQIKLLYRNTMQFLRRVKEKQDMLYILQLEPKQYILVLTLP